MVMNGYCHCNIYYISFTSIKCVPNETNEVLPGIFKRVLRVKVTINQVTLLLVCDHFRETKKYYLGG